MSAKPRFQPFQEANEKPARWPKWLIGFVVVAGIAVGAWLLNR